MKDKRNLLKIAYIFNIIYILLFIIYSLFFIKINDSVKVNIFIRILEIIPTVILYRQSKYEINYIKNNKLPIIICGIWLVFDPFITGVLCFIFLSKIKEKKINKIPEIKHNKSQKKDYLKSFIAIIVFVIIYYVLPYFSFFEKINDVFKYIFIFIFVIILNFDYLKEDYVLFKNNIKLYIRFIIKRYLIMLLCLFLVALPIYFIIGNETSSNQSILNSFFKEAPLKMLLLTSLYAPFVEECIFRLDIRKIINNKVLFIIISGLIFGLLHVIDYLPNIKDCLYLFVYVSLGINLAKAYLDSNNIFVSISMHFMQNFIASVLVIILSL